MAIELNPAMHNQDAALGVPTTRTRTWALALLAFAFGAASVLAFAPFGQFWIMPLALLALLWLVDTARTRRAAAMMGFLFGAGFFIFGVSWVYVSLHQFGGMPAALAALATLIFCLILALFPAAAAYLLKLFRSGALAYIVAFPVLWVLGEWARGSVSAGFPWNAAGYSQTPATPLAGYAPLLGVFGVSLMVGLSAGLAYWAYRSKRFAAAVLALALLWGGGAMLQGVAYTRPTGAPISVSLLQGNVAQETKFVPDKALATLALYERMILASDARLIVLPETAFALFHDELPPGYLDRLRAHALLQGSDIIAGVPQFASGRERNDYYNAAFNLGSAPTQFYRKHHLVPFGEYLPLRPVFGWVLDFLHIPLSDFSRGETIQPPFPVAGQQLAVNICYENVFGNEIAAALPHATLLANLTNDAWFGRSLGPQQHLQIAQMRALETGRMMLRATNTGVTAIIDTRGRIVARAPEYVVTSLNGTVQGYAGMTPYAYVKNHWLWSLPAVLLLLWWWQRRKPA